MIPYTPRYQFDENICLDVSIFFFFCLTDEKQSLFQMLEYVCRLLHFKVFNKKLYLGMQIPLDYVC